MNHISSHILFCLCLIALSVACQKEHIEKDENRPAEQRLNKFISQTMKDIYYWADEVKDRNPDLDNKPGEFLQKMMFSEDQWSMLLKDNVPVRSVSDGQETGIGYDLQFYSLQDFIFAMILYVYPGTPADQAGLKRGQIIVKNNGEYLNTSTYKDFANAKSVCIQLGEFREGTLHAFTKQYQLQATTFEADPIYLDTVFQIAGKNIGYLFYTQFIYNQKNSLERLNEVFREFKQKGIDEFILDLRYNPGGAVNTAKRLCSLLAPAHMVQREELLITKKWNAKYQSQYENTADLMEERLDPAVLPENLNLKRIFFLVSERTASASELVISGLSPYMPVTIIGKKTTGKYVGAISRQPQDDDLKAWELYPIVFSYQNANHESVKGGILPSPDCEMEEFSDYLFPIGDMEDPLLGKAISLITGQEVASYPSQSLSARSSTAAPVKIKHNSFREMCIQYD